MRNVILYIPVLFLLLNFVSCSTPEVIIPLPEGETGEVTLYFRNSGQRPTRALNDSLESVIDNIDILAFEASGTGQNFSYRRSINQGDIISDPKDYSMKHFTVTVPKDRKIYKYVVLANVRTEVDQCFGSGDHKGEAKDDLLSTIVSSESSAWNVDGNNFRRLPMWGESEGMKTIEALNNQTIYLYRSLAAIDITVDALVPFSLKEVYVYNRPTNGRVAPDMNFFNSSQKRFTQPSLPASLNRADEISAGAQATPVIANATNVLKNSLYLFETEKFGSDNFLKATCLVLGGYRTNQQNMSYYRVDFADYRDYNSGNSTPPSWEQGPPTTDKGEGGFVGSGDTYYPLLRNHRYNIKVTGITGAGSTTPLVAAQTQHSQMITEFTTWNSIDENVYIDNNPYELKIDKTSVNLKDNSSEMISLSTTYPGKWIIDDQTESWFICYVGGSADNAVVYILMNGSPTVGNTAYFKVKLIDENNNNREVISQLIRVEYK